MSVVPGPREEEEENPGDDTLSSPSLPLSISLAISCSSLASNNSSNAYTAGGGVNPPFISPAGSSSSSSNSQGLKIVIGNDPFRSSGERGSREWRVQEVEADPGVLARRQKQIDYGKGTTEYANYLKAVPVEDRGPCHPRTPQMHRKYSRRAWDGLIKRWRLNLHCWTYPEVSDLARLDVNGNHLELPPEFFLNPQDEDSSLLLRRQHRPLNLNLNESFSSTATTQTTSSGSSSISANSSMERSLSMIFKDLNLRDNPHAPVGGVGAGGAQTYPLRLPNPFDESQKEFRLFSPTPQTRPSSSLCFAELHRSRPQDPYGPHHHHHHHPHRQSSSEQNLASSNHHTSSTTGGNAGTSINHVQWWKPQAADNRVTHQQATSDDFFRWFLKNN